MLTLLILGASASVSPVVDPHLTRMVDLYEKVCLQAFPDDRAVEALMKAEGARELSAADVAVTMGDDPAKGWSLTDDSASVWLEFPPFHACSVRWNTSQIGDLAPYRAAADRFARLHGGFEAMRPYDADQGDIHVHMIGEQKLLPERGMESLLIVDQQISDPERRAAGETGVVLRFVHQIVRSQPPGD